MKSNHQIAQGGGHVIFPAAIPHIRAIAVESDMSYLVH
jgi:hypothetical protein